MAYFCVAHRVTHIMCMNAVTDRKEGTKCSVRYCSAAVCSVFFVCLFFVNGCQRKHAMHAKLKYAKQRLLNNDLPKAKM